jgi:hypothetical protein
LFAFVHDQDMEAVRQAMGTSHGRTWKRAAPQGEQAPAIEFHCGNRYFTVTNRHIRWTPKELRTVPLADLIWLIQEAGPAFKRGADALSPSDPPTPTQPQFSATGPEQLASANSNDSLQARLQDALQRNTKLAARWQGSVDGLNDQSRSARDQSLTCLLRREGLSYEETRQLLIGWTHGAGAEKATDDRYFQRMWDNAEPSVGASAAADSDVLQKPDMGVLNQNRRPPVRFPLELLGSWWSKWVAQAAKGAAAPPDYVAAPLLAAASVLLGNARWAQAVPGWREPPVLWCASVGNPSSGKSPAAAPVVNDLIAQMESNRARDFKERYTAWQTQAEECRVRESLWRQEVEQAVRENRPPPTRPPEADPPPEPVQPRLRTSDATTEKIARMLAGNQKGLLILRDELAGVFGSFDRYTGASADRPFYLESYSGGSYIQDRVKHPVPIFIERLSLGLFGTIQPDRLAEVIRGADDGLLPRFLWFWPESMPLRINRDKTDIQGAVARLQRLNDLLLREIDGEEGKFVPVYVQLTSDAVDLLETFAQELQRKETTSAGLLLSAIGKARGHVLRLAIVLEYLWWCGRLDDTPEPSQVSVEAVEAAVRLVREYFVPMAERVYGDAAATPTERDAKALAGYIVVHELDQLNLRELRRAAPGWHGPKERGRLDAAAQHLVEAGWLTHVGKPSSQGGRPSTTYRVNPRVFDLLAARDAPPKAA